MLVYHTIFYDLPFQRMLWCCLFIIILLSIIYGEVSLSESHVFSTYTEHLQSYSSQHILPAITSESLKVDHSTVTIQNQDGLQNRL